MNMMALPNYRLRPCRGRFCRLCPKKYAGLVDPVIEIAITPNRGDCLGVRGIARDLAAAVWHFKDIDFRLREICIASDMAD